MSCPQIWNIEQEKDREKEKVGDRPAKLNEKEGDRDLEREINKGDIFLLEFSSNKSGGDNEKFQRSPMQGENERQ